MPAKKKPEVQERTAQLGIKINADLYERYKAKLKEDGISITEDIETHMRNYVGEVIVKDNVIDITKVMQLSEEMECVKKQLAIVQEAVGELNPGWQEKTSLSKAS